MGSSAKPGHSEKRESSQLPSQGAEVSLRSRNLDLPHFAEQ